MAGKKVSIVILNYNTKTLLKKCLDSIFDAVNSKHQIPNSNIQNLKYSLEIIIVDNNSTDGSKEYLKKLTSRNWEISSPSAHEISSVLPREIRNFAKQISQSKFLNFKVIFNDRNLGFAAGNNVGIKYAIKSGADYVIVLNNDVLVKDAFWRPLVDFLEKNKKVGIVAPKIYFAPGREFHKSRYKKSERGKVIWSVGGTIDWQNVIASNRGVDEVDKGQYDQEAEVDFASGCCLAASAAIWEKVNFFDERYFLYYEDSDFCQRVRRAGYKIVYVPGSKIWHLNAGSSKVGGDLHDYFITRNRLLFGMRWASWRAKFALFRESLRLFRKTGRKWQKIGVRDFYLRKLGKGSWKGINTRETGAL